jgi:RNA polymerase sigma-70 factor (ECF subfamily)
MFRNYKNKREKEEFLLLLQSRMEVLYRIAFSYFKDKDSAADAVQDSVLIAFNKLGSLKDKEKFGSWITTILVNRCKEILRKNKKTSFEESDDKIIPLNSELYRRNTSEFTKVDSKLDVINLLGKLDYKYSEVIRLKYFGDYTLEEISLILDIPLGTVKSRLNTGIKKLKGLMEVNGDVV